MPVQDVNDRVLNKKFLKANAVKSAEMDNRGSWSANRSCEKRYGFAERSASLHTVSATGPSLMAELLVTQANHDRGLNALAKPLA
jgi:hypothetical protein